MITLHGSSRMASIQVRSNEVLALVGKDQLNIPMHSSVLLSWHVFHVLCLPYLTTADHIRNDAGMLTTEVSQVPLSGVLALLKSARLVSPSVLVSTKALHKYS